MKKPFLLLPLLVSTLLSFAQVKDMETVVVAYVTAWNKVMPDPTMMTHINYAFGHVNEEFNGVSITNEERLRSIVALKAQHPALQVLLSIGGWGSGRFSEMAASRENRKAFARDCRRICQEFGLDGIDIDWEYPTQSSANISSSPQDTEHFTLLMRDLRKALGRRKWLTAATVASAQYIDFKQCIRYMDLVNVMAYDMADPPHHHSALYRSDLAGWLTSEEAVEKHRQAGVPDHKLVMGMPFYGRGEVRDYFRNPEKYRGQYTEAWDNIAKVPYLLDQEGKMVSGFENPRSLSIKCQYIKSQGLRGGMYWEYADDNEQGEERRAVQAELLQKSN